MIHSLKLFYRIDLRVISSCIVRYRSRSLHHSWADLLWSTFMLRPDALVKKCWLFQRWQSCFAVLVEPFYHWMPYTISVTFTCQERTCRFYHGKLIESWQRYILIILHDLTCSIFFSWCAQSIDLSRYFTAWYSCWKCLGRAALALVTTDLPPAEQRWRQRTNHSANWASLILNECCTSVL
jgi:hypothetical protein